MRRDGIAEEARGLREVVSRLERTAKTTPVPSGVRARAVGVSVGSVRNWRREPPVTALVPVVVTPSRVGERAGLTVVAPSGYRVEGLDLSTTAALLRALE